MCVYVVNGMQTISVYLHTNCSKHTISCISYFIAFSAFLPHGSPYVCYNLLRDTSDIIIIVIVSFNRVHMNISIFNILQCIRSVCVFCSILLINSVCCCCCFRWFSVDNGVKYDASRAYLSDLNVTENIWIGLMRSQNSDRFMWS